MGPRLQGFPFVLILSSVCIICFSFVVSNLTVVSFACMAHRTRRGTNNSAAAMLDSNQPSSSADPPSSAASPPINSNPVTTPPSVILSQQDLSRAFSQALGDTLPRIWRLYKVTHRVLRRRETRHRTQRRRAQRHPVLLLLTNHCLLPRASPQVIWSFLHLSQLIAR